LPTFKVLGNEPLLELATWVKEHPGVDPVRFPKAPRNLRGRRLEALRRALKRARALPPSDWPALPKPGPRPPGALSDGPTTDRIRKARNALATSLEIGPGFLAPNASLTAIVAAAPRTVDQLRRAGRLLPWQAEAVGESFLEILRKGDEQA
jgi:ribonuclease D